MTFGLFGFFTRHRKGNVAILFALTSPVILMALSIVVDYSRAVTVKSELQAALDASVLAGAKASSANATTVASNFFTADSTSFAPGATASFGFNTTGQFTGATSYPLTTLFAKVTGASTMTLNLTSAAAAGSTQSTQNVCILLTAPSTSQSLLANSGTNINAPNCEIDVDSTANPAAIFNSGTTITASRLCLKGTQYIKNGGTETTLVAGCNAVTNPYVGKLPAPPSTSCTGANANGGNFSGTITLSPGVYCGWFNFNNAPQVTLLPGVYVIKNGGWNVDGGSWVGSGVTFYFADTSHIQYNSGMNMTISAPSSGTYAGILFYEPDGLSNSQFVFDDSQSESMSGLIYLPSRSITFNSTSNATTPNVTVIAYTAIFNTLNWNLSPSSQWAITTSSTTSGGTPTLVQ